MDLFAIARRVAGGPALSARPSSTFEKSLGEILEEYDVAYVKDVLEINADPDHPDRDWEIFTNVKDLQEKFDPSRMKPVQVVGKKVVDGANRLSALALLMKEDPQLRSMKVQVEEFSPEDWEEHKKKTGQHPDA